MDLFPTTTTSRLPARSRRWARLGGAWLEASIEYSTTKSDLFDLALSLRAADGPVIQPALSERWAALSLDPAHPRYAATVLAGSEILRIANALAAGEQRASGRPDRGGPERKQRRGRRPGSRSRGHSRCSRCWSRGSRSSRRSHAPTAAAVVSAAAA